MQAKKVSNQLSQEAYKTVEHLQSLLDDTNSEILAFRLWMTEQKTPIDFEKFEACYDAILGLKLHIDTIFINNIAAMRGLK